MQVTDSYKRESCNCQVYKLIFFLLSILNLRNNTLLFFNYRFVNVKVFERLTKISGYKIKIISFLKLVFQKSLFLVIYVSSFFCIVASCTVDYVRSMIETKTLDDSKIQDIIDFTTDTVLAQCGVSDDSDSNIALAVQFSVLANVTRKMKITGELAPSIKTGNSQRNNSADVDISNYQQMANTYMSPYIAQKSTYSNPSMSYGLTTSGGRHGFHR